jgi:predicted nucleic acid-binding Zn ribbon protein
MNMQTRFQGCKNCSAQTPREDGYCCDECSRAHAHRQETKVERAMLYGAVVAWVLALLLLAAGLIW